MVLFPSSSSPKGHPAGPSRRATGGGRPPGGVRAGPGAHCGVGPAWVARGLFPAEQPSNPATGAKSEDAHFTSVFSGNHRLACAVSRLSALEPSRRRPLEWPPRGQGRRVTGRPSPPRSKNRAALPDQQPTSLTSPSPTSPSSGSMYDPNDVPRQHLRRPRRRRDGDEAPPREREMLSGEPVRFASRAARAHLAEAGCGLGSWGGPQQGSVAIALRRLALRSAQGADGRGRRRLC